MKIGQYLSELSKKNESVSFFMAHSVVYYALTQNPDALFFK